MIRHSILVMAIGAGAGMARAQVGEISVSGGDATVTKVVGHFNATADVIANGGFTLGIRLTLNTWRFLGHEIGYAYDRTSISSALLGAGSTSIPVHQGFYDFLVYPIPEGKKIRPFVCGGVQFSSFFPPGTSVYYGNQITKFGVNYGGGIKVRLNQLFGLRFDVRQYNMGQPFRGFTPTGRFLLTQFTAGGSINF